MVSKLKIEVVSDVICPWCFLGKRRLDKALATLPEVSAEVVFRPYFLDPGIPPQGYDRHQYLTEKFGEARLATLHEPLEEAGAKDGVPYHFEKITRTPNTLDAHRLIRWAKQAGKQADVVEALFCAYWRDGLDIGDSGVLVNIARSCGMDGDEVAHLLPTGTDAEAVLDEVRKAYALGVQGVPTFIINDKYGISGAQEAGALAEAIKKIAGEAA